MTNTFLSIYAAKPLSFLPHSILRDSFVTIRPLAQLPPVNQSISLLQVSLRMGYLYINNRNRTAVALKRGLRKQVSRCAVSYVKSECWKISFKTYEKEVTRCNFDFSLVSGCRDMGSKKFFNV